MTHAVSKKPSSLPAHQLFWRLTIAAFLACPLVTLMLVVSFPGANTHHFSSFQWMPDAFNAGKVVWLCATAVFLGVPALFWTWFCEGKAFVRLRNIALLPALAFGAWLVMLACLVHRSPLAWTGFFDHFEGWPVFAGYLVVFLVGSTLPLNETSRGFLITALAASTLAVVVVGAAQYFGFALWDVPLVRKLIHALPSQGLQLQTVWGVGSFSSSLFNPNWAGTFLAGASALALVAATLANTPRGFWACAVWHGACVFGLAASGYRFGFFALLILNGSFLIWLLWGRNARRGLHMRRVWALIVLQGGLFATVTTHRGPTSLMEMAEAPELALSGLHPFEGVRLEPKLTRFAAHGAALRFTWRGKDIVWLQEAPSALPVLRLFPSGQHAPMQMQSDVFSFRHPALWDVTLTRGASFSDAASSPWRLSFGPESVEVVFTPSGPKVLFLGVALEPQTPVTWPSGVSDAFASLRGFLWTRTLPLVATRPWVGFGPGHFPDVFPQTDVVGRVNSGILLNRVAEKPHNLYLQMAVQFGVVGLLLYLAVVVAALARVFRSPTKTALSLALAAFLVALHIAHLGSDSNVGTSTLTWLCLGLLTGWPASRTQPTVLPVDSDEMRTQAAA